MSDQTAPATGGEPLTTSAESHDTRWGYTDPKPGRFQGDPAKVAQWCIEILPDEDEFLCNGAGDAHSGRDADGKGYVCEEDVVHLARAYLALRAEREGEQKAIREKVEAAWRDGWASGSHAAGGLPLTAHTWDDEAWDCSPTKAALASPSQERTTP